MVDAGTISPGDRSLFLKTDCIDEAFDYTTSELLRNAIDAPGGML